MNLLHITIIEFLQQNDDIFIFHPDNDNKEAIMLPIFSKKNILLCKVIMNESQ